MARSRDRAARASPADRQGLDPCPPYPPGAPGADTVPAGAPIARGDEAGPQQIRGSCSPTSMSTIRSDPTSVWIVTIAG